MLSALLFAMRQKNATDAVAFPDLPEGTRSLPKLTAEPCVGEACGRCAAACPTSAITLGEAAGQPTLSLDRGLCVTCGACVELCPSGTIVYDGSTRTAVGDRGGLVLRQPEVNERANDRSLHEETKERPNSEAGVQQTGPTFKTQNTKSKIGTIFSRSVDIREVSTGCNATDLEVAAITNPIFDCSRFGIHFVASPRFADLLLITGPVGKAMQGPLLRCYESMAEPRLAIAVGTCAISGGVHRGGYAEANGVMPHLSIAAFVPGCPPHPWSIIHGILTAIDSPSLP